MNIYDALILKALGGGGGTTVVANPEGEATDELEKLQVGSGIYGIPKDYEEMSNKPSINSVELSGNKTASDLGLQPTLDGAQTVSGNPITVTDAQPMNAESVLVELEPKQDLHGYDKPWVGGSGKNKFDVSQYDSGYFTRNNETLTNALTDTKSQFNLALWTDISNVQTTNLINENIAENGTYSYTFTVDEPSVDSLVLKHNGSNRDLIISDFPWTAQGTFTLSLTVEGHDPSTVGGLVISNIQIESGNQATTYEPYSNICPISGYSEVNVERVGKNLLNSNYYSGSHASQNNVDIVKNDDGSLNVTINGSCESTVNYLFKNTDTSSGLKSGNYKATVKAEGSYTGNINLVLGGASSTLPYSDIAMNNVASLTVPSDDATIGYCLLQIPTGATVTGTLKLYPMIADEDANMTVFEPYQGNTYTISLGGTKYGGTLDVTEGVLTVDRGYYKVTNATEIGANPSGWNPYYPSYYFNVEPLIINDNMNISVISNMMQGVTREQIQGLDSIYVCSMAGAGSEIDFTSDIDNASDVKQFLIDNDCEFCYKLAASLAIQLTPTQIQMLENTNNISTDGTNIQLKYQPNNVIGEVKVYTDEKCSEVLPPLPTTDGTYHLSCEVTSGVGVLSWVSDS